MADGSVIIDSKLDSSGFEKGLKGLGSVASKGLAATTKAIGAVSTGLIALGGYAVKVGSSFESAMSQVSATMGYSSKDLADKSSEAFANFEKLSETAKKLGSTTQFSATQAGEALNYLALAGMDADKACATLPGVLNLAAAGGMDLATASDQITDAMSSLGIEFDAQGKNVTEFADKMAKTAQKSNTSVQQLGEAILTVGGTAKVLAGGTTEMNTALGILADNGIKGAEGGTALRNVILSLTAPTDKAADAMDRLGISALDGQGNVRQLKDTFRDLDKALSTMSDGEKTQVLNEIFNKVDLKSVNALLANSGERFDELSGYINNANGACATMAETMNDNLKGRITELKSAAEGFGIQIYESMEMPLKKMAESGIESIGKLSEALNSGGFSGMAETIGSLMAQGIAKIAEYAPQVIQASTTIIQSFIQGISDNLPQIISSAGEIVSSLVNGIIVIIPQLVTLGGQILSELAKGIISNTSSVSKSATEIITKFINGLTENLPEIIKTGTEVIKSLSDGIAESLPEIIPVAIEAIIQFAESILDNLDTIVDCALEIIVSLAEGLINALPTLIEKAPIIVEKLVDGIIKAIPKIIEAVGEIIDSLLKALINNSPKIIEGAYKIIGKLAEGLIKGIHLVIEGTKKIIDKITTTITTTDWIEVGKNVIQGFINGITSMVSNVGSAIKGVCDSAIKSAKSALGIHSPSKVFKEEVGQFIGEGMAKGIEESSVEASKATTEMCNSVLSNGKAFLEKQKAQDKAWSDSKKEQYAAQKQALYDYIQKKKELNQLKLEDEKYIYQQLLKAAKGNQKEIEEINKKIVEADEEAYQKRYANSKQWIADKKYFNQLSLQDELAAYERMKDYSKGHAEETKEIEKEIYRVKKEIVAKEVQDVKDANAKILDELKDRVDKEKQIINGKRDSALDSLQSQLDAIDKAEEERQNNMTIADYENELIKYREALANASDPEEQQRINEQLYEKQKAYDEWKYQQELKAKKEAIRAQMDEVRAQAEEQIAVKEDEYEKEKTMLEKQQEAMIKAIENGQAEMVKAIKEGGAQSLNIQDANAIRAMGINKSLTKDKQENLDKQYQAVIDNENKSAKAVEDACVEMYRQNYRMGEQMVNGIADGILNRTWRAVKAMSMMCDKVTNEAKKKLDIHSPSRVFKRLGQYVDQGFENGITVYSDSVISSMSGMCDRLKNVVNVDDLVGRMSSAVNGQIAVTSNLMTSGLAGITTNNTTTNNNTSNTPITINVYGNDREDDKYGRNLASQIKRELRGRGLR